MSFCGIWGHSLSLSRMTGSVLLYLIWRFLIRPISLWKEEVCVVVKRWESADSCRFYFSVICIKNLNKRIANQIISVQFYTIGLEVWISNNNGNKSLVYFVLKGLLFSSRDIEVLSYFRGVSRRRKVSEQSETTYITPVGRWKWNKKLCKSCTFYNRSTFFVNKIFPLRLCIYYRIIFCLRLTQ